jgi:hypothetical protein
MSHRQYWALCLLRFLERRDHRGRIGGLRSSDRNSATTRDCTAPVRALFVDWMENCETKQLSQYPYEEAKFRHNLHKRPSSRTLGECHSTWTVARLKKRDKDRCNCGNQEHVPGQGTQRFLKLSLCFVGHIITRNCACLETASVLLRENDAIRPA